MAKKKNLIQLERLDDLADIRGISLQEVCDSLKMSPKSARSLIEDGEVSRKAAFDLSLLLGVSLRQLINRNEFEGGSGFRTSSPYQRSPEMDGYFGQVGLRVTAGQPTRWFPISDRDHDAVLDALEEGDGHDPIVLHCLGGSSLLINPTNVTTISLLPEAADGVEDDFEVSPLDPVCGINQAALELLGVCSCEDGLLGENISGKARSGILEVVDDLGGWEGIEAHLYGADIHYADGTVEALTDGSGINLARDIASYGTPSIMRLSSETGVTRFVNMRNVAFIRFPSFTARFRSIDEMIEDAYLA